MKERREAFAQAELESKVPHRQELPVTPQGRFAAGQGGPVHGRPRGFEVIAGEEGLAALRAEVPEPVGVDMGAAEAAFEVGEEALRTHRIIL